MKKVISSILLIIGLVLIAVSGYKIYSIQSDYSLSNSQYEKLNINNVVTYEWTEQDPWYNMASVNLDEVRSINSDVIGWLWFENEDISYPIMYSGDDSTYLHKTIEGNTATAGSIFLEGKSSPDLNDSYSIIYGHNMKNLSMFGKLKYYNRQEDYYDEHQYFQIFTDDYVYRYQIFAYETVAEEGYVYTLGWENDSDFEQFLNKIYNSSAKETGVQVTKDDKVITLSTCSTSGEDYRFIVSAVRVDQHKLEGEE